MQKSITRFFAIIFAICGFKFFGLDFMGALGGFAFMGDITNADRRGREDLSSVIDILNLKDDDMKYLSFTRFLGSIAKVFGKKVERQKHEWLDDVARYETVNAGLSGTGLLWDSTSVKDLLTLESADEGKKLRVGDVLLLGDLAEVVIVKSIASDFLTISVYARGHGSTTGAAQGEVAFAMEIIGNAQIENGDPIDADFTPQTEGVNYCQIFEDVAQITGTVRRSNMVNGDVLDIQVVKKTKELMKSLNRALVEGIKNLDTTNKIGTMGGLREAFTNTSNVGGALTVAKLYTAIISHVNAGLFPSAIHGSPTTIGDIEQLYQGAVRTTVSEKRGGTEINTIVVLGYEIELHADKHVRSTEALIIDYNRCAYGPLDGGSKGENGSFAQYRLYDKDNGKQKATQVLGEYTMRVSNGGGTRMYGIS